MEFESTYGVVDDVLRPRIIVDVDGDATQGGHLGRQLVQPRVVLALALVGFRHRGLFICLLFPGAGEEVRRLVRTRRVL